MIYGVQGAWDDVPCLRECGLGSDEGVLSEVRGSTLPRGVCTA